MADFVFNIAKGRVVELFRRVQAQDPSTSRLILVVLKTTSLQSDAILKDYDTLAQILAGGSLEATNTGYSRKVLQNSDLTFPAPDDTNDRMDIDLPDQTWSAVQSSGGAWSVLLVCYAPTSGSADSAIIPLTAHNFVVTPDGSDITAQIAAAGFFRGQ